MKLRCLAGAVVFWSGWMACAAVGQVGGARVPEGGALCSFEEEVDEVWLDEPGLWERLSSFHSCPHVTNRWAVASGDVLGHCVIGCTDNALIIGLNLSAAVEPR